MRTIIFKHVHHITTDYLPAMFQSDILPDVDFDEEDHDQIRDKKSQYLNESIKIETLREILDDIEERGANYVSIDYHTDHNEYELDGFLIKEATQEEIDTEANRKKEYELKKLNDELDRIERTANNFRSQIENLKGVK